MLHNPKLAAVLCKPKHTAKSVKSHKTPREDSLNAILCDPQFKDACGNHSDGMTTEKKSKLALNNLLSRRLHTLWRLRLSDLHRCFSAFAAEPRAEPANPGQGSSFPPLTTWLRRWLENRVVFWLSSSAGIQDPGVVWVIQVSISTRSTCTLRPFHRRPSVLPSELRADRFHRTNVQT